MRRNVLAKFRKAAGLSQTELAKRSGVSFKYITAIEQEDRVPGVDFAEKLATVLGVAAERIFFRPSSAGTDRLTALEQLHPGVLGQLPFDDVARIERVLAAMTPDMAKSVLSPKRTWEQALGALVIFDAWISRWPEKWPKVLKVANLKKGEVLGVSRLPWVELAAVPKAGEKEPR